MKLKRGVAGLVVMTLALVVFAKVIRAQEANRSESQPASKEYKTFYLANVTQPQPFSDIVRDIRNMLPQAKVYYVSSQNAVSILGTPDELALAQKIISDTDRAPKTYRLTYTITDKQNGASVGTRDVSLVVAAGGKTTIKQGNRVPIATGTTGDAGSASTQMQYLDVGLSIEASVDGSPDHLKLHTRVEQSSVAEEKTVAGTQDPVIRQTALDGVSNLEQGKSIVLGSLDVPGSSRREEISVRSEVVQ
ncbi:MAG: hypothetical protein ACRD3F_03655 [Acidobacteriaceae bacterium]